MRHDHATSVCRYGGIPCGLFTVPGRATRAAPYRLSNLWPPSILPIYLRVSRQASCAGTDRFVLSKAMRRRLYSTLAHKGYFPLEWLDTLRTVGSPLQGHPNLQAALSGLCRRFFRAGPSIANGMALALKLKGKPQQVFCLIGDGNSRTGLGSGSFAGQHHLDNVCLIVDCNGLQLVDSMADIKDMEPGCQVGKLWLACPPRRRSRYGCPL